MKTIVRGLGELTVRKVGLSCARGWRSPGCASDPRPLVVGQPITLPASTTTAPPRRRKSRARACPARNVLMTDYQAFSRAYAFDEAARDDAVRRLRRRASTRRPRMISCKLHSAERIRAEYGATAAGESTTCARLNRRTLDAVMLTLTRSAEEEDAVQGRRCPWCSIRMSRRRTKRSGSKAFTMVADGRGRHAAHPRQEPARQRRQPARALGSQPATSDGRQYCHLIAPDYLKRILTGEVQLPKAEFPERARPPAGSGATAPAP